MFSFTKLHHHLYKRDSVSFYITLTILAIITLTFTPSPSSANPTPLKLLTLPPIPSPEALQSFQEELPTPISLKGSQPNSNSNSNNLEKNICEAVPDRIFFCNCDSYERPVDVACFATVNSSNPLHPDWLDFAAQSPVLSTSVTAFKLTAFNGHTFSYLPLTAINHLRPSLVKLTVSGLGLRTLATNAISGFTELEEVDFQGCTSLALEEERPFGSLPKLHKLIINDANIGTLRRLFDTVPVLEEVYIAKSKIRSIQVEGEGGVDGAFTGMESCQYLDLDQNAIEEVSQATFRGLRNLKELQLNWNAIRHLPAGTFAEMPLLTEIELSHNAIESVDPAAFAGLPRLQSLKLEYNRLREFPAAGLFSANRQLTVVDIAFNFFTTVSWTVFHQPAASGGNRYIRFRIQGNEIQCTCSIAWMSKALKFYDSIVEQELQTVDCKYPEGDDPQQQLPFIRSSPPDRRPKSIYAFITHPEVASGCKLPTALLQAEKSSATEEEERKRKLKAGGGDNQNTENDYDDANDNEQAKKTISEMNGNEVGVSGGVEGEQSGQPTTPKVTRVYENGNENEGGNSGVHKSPHDSSAVLKDTNDKSTNQLNQAQFGAGSAAPPRTTAVSAFALTVLLLFVSFLSFVR